MKTYIGDHVTRAVTVEEDGRRRPLDPCFHIRNHSPDGFSWGYMGSGPAQLALALLRDVYGTGRKTVHYQRFKDAFIAHLPQDESWRFTDSEIRDIVGLVETCRSVAFWLDRHHRE